MRELSKRQHYLKLASLMALSVCFLLFQNMAPTSLDVNLQELAPAKPEGYQEKSFFPSDIHAQSLNEVGQAILEHNFRDQLDQIQFELEASARGRGIFRKASSSRGPASITPSAAQNASSSALSRVRMGLSGGDKISISYLSPINLKMDYSALSQKFALSLETHLTEKTELLLKHTSSDQTSALHLRYQW